jgi:hypothetical protein
VGHSPKNAEKLELTMSYQSIIPESSTRERHAVNLKAACEKLDEFGELLDRSIAMLDAQIAKQPKRRKQTIPPAKN